MNAPRQLLIREVQLAYMLGFADVGPFRRALRAGEIPAPSEYVRGAPVWHVSHLERRYGAGFAGDSMPSERDVLAAIEGV